MNLKQTIRKVLREEVNETYLKPSESMDRLIDNWLEKLFSGSKMYHQEQYRTRHDFNWCNKGIEIVKVILFFNDDETVYSYKRPTSELDFVSGSLYIPKSIIDDLVTYVPIKRNYVKYKIEEWFENNILPNVIEKMGRNDIRIDDMNEYPVNAEVCVPPVEKPKGVTQEEMINLIVKTTLYKRDELLKREEEESGFIEKLYLNKLHDLEIDKLRGE